MENAQATPVVKLGGREFQIPLMAPRQMRIIMPTALALGTINKETLSQMTSETFDKIMDIVHAGVSRANKEVSRDELMDLPIGIDELLIAVAVICSQCGGGLKKVDPKALEEALKAEESPKSPETPQASSPIGTGS